MNLADIRRKANQERLLREEAGCRSSNQGGAAEKRFGVVPCTDAGTSVTVAAAPTPFPFDPLGVILAGREAVAAAISSSESDSLAPEEETDGYLGFTVAGESYVVAIDRVREVLRPRRITSVPRAPSWITGIISHRGAIVTVIDLAGRMGLQKQPCTGSERIMIVRASASCCGFIVDRVERVVLLTASAIEPLPTRTEADNREVVSGLSHYQGRLLAHLDIDKVLAIAGSAT